MNRAKRNKLLEWQAEFEEEIIRDSVEIAYKPIGTIEKIIKEVVENKYIGFDTFDSKAEYKVGEIVLFQNQLHQILGKEGPCYRLGIVK